MRVGLGFIDYDNDPLQTLEDIAVLSDEERDIVIHFYIVGDHYAAVFEGLDPDTRACVLLSTGGQRDGEDYSQWHFIRAALPNGHCHQLGDEIPNTESQGVQLCNGRVALLSSFLVEEKADGLHAQIDFLDRRPGGIIGGGGTSSGGKRFVVNELLPAADIEQISC